MKSCRSALIAETMGQAVMFGQSPGTTMTPSNCLHTKKQLACFLSILFLSFCEIPFVFEKLESTTITNQTWVCYKDKKTARFPFLYSYGENIIIYSLCNEKRRIIKVYYSPMGQGIWYYFPMWYVFKLNLNYSSLEKL